MGAAVTRFLEVDGGRVAYDDAGGDGRLILAIPGMGDLRSEYRAIRPALQRAGHRVITMDVRGFGETSAEWNDYSAHAVGRDALALLTHLDATSAVILGNSFAAGSALWAAHDAPELVSGVVLLGPILRDAKVSAAAKLTLAIGLAGPWRVWFWTSFWNSLFPSHKPFDHGSARAALTKNLREPGRMDALRAMINLSKAETTCLLPHSKVPALVVMGTKDSDFADPREETAWLVRTLGAASLIVGGAGHYPHAELPDQVAPQILAFVDSIRR